MVRYIRVASAKLGNYSSTIYYILAYIALRESKFKLDYIIPYSI